MVRHEMQYRSMFTEEYRMLYSHTPKPIFSQKENISHGHIKMQIAQAA